MIKGFNVSISKFAPVRLISINLISKIDLFSLDNSKEIFFCSKNKYIIKISNNLIIIINYYFWLIKNIINHCPI